METIKMNDSTRARLNDGILRNINTLKPVDRDVWINVRVSNMTTGKSHSFYENHDPKQSWFDFAQSLYQDICRECSEEWRDSDLGNIDDLTIDCMDIAEDYTVE